MLEEERWIFQNSRGGLNQPPESWKIDIDPDTGPAEALDQPLEDGREAFIDFSDLEEASERLFDGEGHSEDISAEISTESLSGVTQFEDESAFEDWLDEQLQREEIQTVLDIPLYSAPEAYRPILAETRAAFIMLSRGTKFKTERVLAAGQERSTAPPLSEAGSPQSPGVPLQKSA